MSLLLYRNLQGISPNLPSPKAAVSQAGGISRQPALNLRPADDYLCFVFIRSSIHTELTTYIPLTATAVLAQETMPGYVGMASGLTHGFGVGPKNYSSDKKNCSNKKKLWCATRQ